MKKAGLLFSAIALFLANAAYASESISLFEQLSPQPETSLHTPALLIQDNASPDPTRIAIDLLSRFGLQKAESLQFVHSQKINEQWRIRYRLYYQNIPVLYHDVLVFVNFQGQITRAYGHLLNGLDRDLGDIEHSDQGLSGAQETQHRAQLDTLLGEQQVLDAKPDKVIYIDSSERAFLAQLWNVKTYSPTDRIISYQRIILDAKTGRLLKRENGLHSAFSEQIVGGAGPSGNPNAPREDYQAQGLENTPPTTFLVQQIDDGNTKRCYFNAGGVITIDAGHQTDSLGEQAFNYDCTQNTYNPERQVNQAKSPLNDAHYRAQATVQMFQHYLGQAPFQNVPIKQYVHYGTNVANAFFSKDSESVMYGDGDSTMYPPVELTVISHEIAHGFTWGVGTTNHKWMSAAEASAINEAFSDMAGQAAEFYLNGSNTWQTGPETTVSGKPRRYMDTPTRDGKSIDHLAQYYTGMPGHYASGLFN